MAILQEVSTIAVVAIEAIGVAVITLSAAWAVIRSMAGVFRGRSLDESFRACRQQLGRGILLGLEFLVAADIINTVAVELTFTSVGILSIIVLIRTFLSLTLEMETTGRWPWARRGTE